MPSTRAPRAARHQRAAPLSRSSSRHLPTISARPSSLRTSSRHPARNQRSATHLALRFSTSPRADTPNTTATTDRIPPPLSDPLLLVVPAPRTSCSRCWTPRLEHHARLGAAARAHAEGHSTTRSTSLKRSRPTTHTSSPHTNDNEVHHTQELRPYSERSGHPSYLDFQDKRRFHPSEGPTGTA